MLHTTHRRLEIKPRENVKFMEKRLLFIIIGAIVGVALLAVLGIFFLVPAITSAQQVTPTPTPGISVSGTTTPGTTKNPMAQALKQYGPSIKQQIAQGLKLTPAQLTTELRSGKTLSQIATVQGVSASQLQSLVSNAIQTGLRPAIDSGSLTQVQVDRYIKRLQNNPIQLDRLLGARAAKTGTPTPTPAQ